MFGRGGEKKNPGPWRRFELGIISGCAVISFHKEDAAA
jgi:hypothetical protein